MKKLLIFPLAFLILGCANVNKNIDKNATASSQNTQKEIVQSEVKDVNKHFGKFKATLPCADCEGIKSTLILNQNGTFTLIDEYLGKDAKFASKGKYNVTGDIITTIDDNKDIKYYKKFGSDLKVVDEKGNDVDSDVLKDMYIYKASK